MLSTIALSVFSLVLSLLFYFSATDSPQHVSPQGCRMSYMSPSYILQHNFNASWTPLARRYSLWLYREVGWDMNELTGMPVLFLPGNAGSSHQVRSIASSAARQYYSSPSFVAHEFASRSMKPLDFFAVEFNEDLSAFHGPTLESQRIYAASAIDYILSLYPPGTSIIVMAHSMGGIVATSLLPTARISSIITMSTPHSVPPARFDSRIDSIYTFAKNRVSDDPVPILSICGGITDTMIPSEFCAIPDSDAGAFRRTVYTSGLEGCWSGVGHREMVWCHQVRWRVARAALELGIARNDDEKTRILRQWFRDGIDMHLAPETSSILDLQPHAQDVLPEHVPLVLRKPVGSRTYLLPFSSLSNGSERQLVIYVSQGSILSVSPVIPHRMKVSVYQCRQPQDESLSTLPSCHSVVPSTLRLIPNPSPSSLFPLPKEGVNEGEGVVVFAADLPTKIEVDENLWMAVKVDDANEEGWVVAAITSHFTFESDANIYNPLLKKTSVLLPPTVLRTELHFPHFLNNVLLIYRLKPTFADTCQESLLSPLLLHTSKPSEAHYHPLRGERPVLLHAHSSAPFMDSPISQRHAFSRGLNLTIFSTGECGVTKLEITVDWWNSLGRWGPRYWNAVLAWGAAVIGTLFYSSWSHWDTESSMPTVPQALCKLVNTTLPKLIAGAFVMSFVPLPQSYWLGNHGEPLMAPIAVIILLLSTGLVAITWFVLAAIMRLLSIMPSHSKLIPDREFRKRGVMSILFTSTMVFLIIPWQVAFSGCYLIYLYGCATGTTPVLFDQHDAHNQRMHILLMMTWCLPVVAPVLAVWIRTLATAGFTTPFDGDHFVINVIGFLMLAYFATAAPSTTLSRRHRWELVPVGHLYAIGAIVTALMGPRSTYRLYEALNWSTIMLVLFRMIPQHGNGNS